MPRVDYDTHGRSYARHRQTDPRIAARIHAALGNARTVLNVGAGAGSYEPQDRWVLAVELSATMRGRRPPGAVVVFTFESGSWDPSVSPPEPGVLRRRPASGDLRAQ